MSPTSLMLDTTGDTREKIIRLLRRGPQTVEGLATALGITRNAVRVQLNLLKKEGIVEAQGSLPSGRRPAAVYGLGKGSTAMFSKASPLVLSQLVKVLAENLSDQQFTDTARELGLRLAGLAPKPSGNVKERVRAAADFLESLGAMVDVHERKGKIIIKGYGCPISGAVEADGRLCLAMSTMVGKLLELPTTERCNREKQPGCCFEINL